MASGGASPSRFAEAGATVAVAARKEVDDLPEGGRSSPATSATATARRRSIDEVVARCGRIDVLVNNAGGSPPADTATAPARFTERIVALNLLAPMYCSQRANHHMQQQESGGSIVNIGSVCGMRPSPTTAAYGAAKAGLINFTTTVAMEWAPQGAGQHRELRDGPHRAGAPVLRRRGWHRRGRRHGADRPPGRPPRDRRRLPLPGVPAGQLRHRRQPRGAPAAASALPSSKPRPYACTLSRPPETGRRPHAARESRRSRQGTLDFRSAIASQSSRCTT